MKRKSLMICLALTLVGVMASGLARAQSLNFTLEIPFEFNIGGKVLPAGQYTIKRSPLGLENALVIESANKKISHQFSMKIYLSNESANENKKLIFTKYGDQRFLSQIWAISPLGKSTRYIVSKSKQEQELEKKAKEDASLQQAETFSIVVK